MAKLLTSHELKRSTSHEDLRHTAEILQADLIKAQQALQKEEQYWRDTFDYLEQAALDKWNHRIKSLEDQTKLTLSTLKEQLIEHIIDLEQMYASKTKVCAKHAKNVVELMASHDEYQVGEQIMEERIQRANQRIVELEEQLEMTGAAEFEGDDFRPS